MATYNIEFKNSSPYNRKFAYVPFREKLRFVSKDFSKFFDFLLPFLISTFGILFLNWNIAQVVILYFIQFILELFFANIKTLLNKNQQSLSGVYIKNDFLKKSGSYKGNLNGLKIRTVIYHSIILIFILCMWPLWFAIDLIFSLQKNLINFSVNQVLIGALILFIYQLFELILFKIKKQEKYTLIGDYYIKFFYQISTLFLFAIIIFIGSLLFGIISFYILNFFDIDYDFVSYLSNLIISIFFFYLVFAQNIDLEYFSQKRNQTLGSSIVNYLRKYKVKFQFLPTNFKVDENEIIEAKVAKKPIAFTEGMNEYFLIIISKKSAFSEKILTEKLGLKNASCCTTEETQEEFGTKTSEVPPFGGLLEIKSYMEAFLKQSDNFVIDLGLSGKIRLSSKDYFSIENPQYF